MSNFVATLTLFCEKGKVEIERNKQGKGREMVARASSLCEFT